MAGIVSAIGTAFAAAVILGILNIYLAEHGIKWPSEEFNWHFISMSFLDMILVTVTLLVSVLVFILVVKYVQSEP